jgi:hypothetical protein
LSETASVRSIKSIPRTFVTAEDLEKYGMSYMIGFCLFTANFYRIRFHRV